jgi:hypothetical protein
MENVTDVLVELWLEAQVPVSQREHDPAASRGFYCFRMWSQRR